MPLHFTCVCGHVTVVPEEGAGPVVRCRVCDRQLAIPPTAAALPPPAPHAPPPPSPPEPSVRVTVVPAAANMPRRRSRQDTARLLALALLALALVSGIPIALAAVGAGIALGIPVYQVREILQRIRSVGGRFAQIASPAGWSAIIDYAHTPDALEKVLRAVHDLFAASKRGRIITVFGCGGNRDRGKRPAMAAIATELSDITIITSDNPRHEDPEAIINEVIAGVGKGSHVYREVDRKKAIMKALTIAQHGDVVLIAGKGHEDYQIIGGEKIHFSDREIVEEYLCGQL